MFDSLYLFMRVVLRRVSYAPLASDMMALTKYSFTFELGEPFHPLEQLLAVLPPASAKVGCLLLVICYM